MPACVNLAGFFAELWTNSVFVGLPLVGTPLRDARDTRDGVPTSGSPTGCKREFMGENPTNGAASVLRIRMAGGEA
jgi:hypothetical protein